MAESRLYYPFDGSCPCSHDADLALTFNDTPPLYTHACLLVATSSVLKNVIEECPMEDGMLHVGRDDKASWQLLLNMVHPISALAPSLSYLLEYTETREKLGALAKKYDAQCILDRLDEELCKQIRRNAGSWLPDKYYLPAIPPMFPPAPRTAREWPYPGPNPDAFRTHPPYDGSESLSDLVPPYPYPHFPSVVTYAYMNTGGYFPQSSNTAPGTPLPPNRGYNWHGPVLYPYGPVPSPPYHPPLVPKGGRADNPCPYFPSFPSSPTEVVPKSVAESSRALPHQAQANDLCFKLLPLMEHAAHLQLKQAWTLGMEYLIPALRKEGIEKKGGSVKNSGYHVYDVLPKKILGTQGTRVKEMLERLRDDGYEKEALDFALEFFESF